MAEIEHKNATARDLLRDGNYAHAFLQATDPIMKACARIMCGDISTGLAELGGSSDLDELTRLIKAYGYWCKEENDSALATLRLKRSERTLKLENFITNGAEVTIFSPPNIDPLKNFENIKLKHLVTGSIDAYKTNIKERLNSDLIISLGIYGTGLPENLFDLNCPVVFWVTDHDFFYSSRHYDLSRAALLVANSSDEHFELSKTYKSRIVSFPGYDFYKSPAFFEEKHTIKNYHIGFTGRAFTPYMRDKAQFLYRLAVLDNPDLNIRIYDGYLDELDYAAMIRSCKFVPTFCRYSGGFQTRAIEVMQQGACALSVDKLEISTLLGKDYPHFKNLSLQSLDEAILYHSQTEQKNEINDLDLIRLNDIFWPSPYKEQRFIKFCLFQLIMTKQIDLACRTNFPIPIELRGYPPREALQLYTGVARENLFASDKTAVHYNFAASSAFFGAILGEGNDRLGRFAIEIFEIGLQEFPENICLKFNAARVLWIFGGKAQAVKLFEELAKATDYSELNTKDPMLSHRIPELAEMFSYDAYFFAAIHNPEEAKLIIKSCALTYLGLNAFSKKHLGVAADILGKSLNVFGSNVAALRILTRVLSKLGKDATEILPVFYQAVELYPPNLCELLSIGVDAEKALQNNDAVMSLINEFALYYLRVRTASNEILPFNAQALQTLKQNRHFLKDWIAIEFYKLLNQKI